MAKSKAPQALASLAALAVLAGVVLLASEEPTHPGLVTLLPVAATLVLIAVGPQAFVNRQLLALRPAVWIGLISYPLYLWHWPLLSYLAIVAEEERGPPLVRLSLVGAAFVAAAATYLLVERPLRFNWPSARAVAFLVGGAVVIGLAVAAIVQFRPDNEDRVAAMPKTSSKALTGAIRGTIGAIALTAASTVHFAFRTGPATRRSCCSATAMPITSMPD